MCGKHLLLSHLAGVDIARDVSAAYPTRGVCPSFIEHRRLWKSLPHQRDLNPRRRSITTHKSQGHGLQEPNGGADLRLDQWKTAGL